MRSCLAGRGGDNAKLSVKSNSPTLDACLKHTGVTNTYRHCSMLKVAV